MPNENSELIKTLRSKSNDIAIGKKKQHAINLDYRDINPLFMGVILVHRPSQFETMQIGVLSSQLLGGNMNVDVPTGNLAFVIATLEFVVDSKPDWFDIFDPDLEYEILEAVYLEYLEWINSFRRLRSADNTQGDSTGATGAVPLVDTANVSSATN